jgi:hypothetical protein
MNCDAGGKAARVEGKPVADSEKITPTLPAMAGMPAKTPPSAAPTVPDVFEVGCPRFWPELRPVTIRSGGLPASTTLSPACTLSSGVPP